MTKQEAIEFMKERLEFWSREFRKDVPEYGEVLKMAIEAMENKSEWVPATEKLPEDDIFVLAQVNGKPLPNINLDNALQIGCYSDEGWEVSEWPEWENPDVVAWMPLPEPYHP